MAATEKYVLRFSHKIIEHLGIKLYQNKPTNVIAELVSNAWDAEAKNVWIGIGRSGDVPYVVAMDDGFGMSPEVIQKSYLVIGKPKRPKDEPAEKSPNMQRYLMGRKGIGKLAPFGIAGKIHIISVTVDEGTQRVTWLAMDLAKMRELEEIEEDVNVYEPETYCSNASTADFLAIADEKKKKSTMSGFLQKLNGGTGTMIVMTRLSTKRIIKPEAIRESMGRRFTVTLLRDDFNVFVDDVRITEKEALPEFAFTIGSPSAPNTDSITASGRQFPVKFWAGFVGAAQWPQDQAGVGVYTHGKLAQDRPFTFGLKGNEIFSRYMYGVVEADWLDELPEDLVSTDRTTIDWEHTETEALREWGEKKVRDWISQYQKFRKSDDREKTVKRIRESKQFHLSEAETEAIADLLSEISSSIGNDETTRERAIESLAGAWVHQPMREMTKKLWDSLKAEDGGAQHFVKTIEQLRDYLVPESLSLAVTFAQRIYALTALYKRIHEGTETDLQRLIETFPWILQPEMEKLTANQQLKTVIQQAEEKGLISVAQIGPAPADGLKPDFVYFSPPGETERIVVVELKNPGQEHHLTLQNQLQLITYMMYLRNRYAGSDIKGYLIGNNYARLEPTDKDVKVLDWSDVLRSSRKGHVELLASMLVGANPDPNDTRVAQVAEFGGKEAKELLVRLAQNDETLQSLTSALGDPG